MRIGRFINGVAASLLLVVAIVAGCGGGSSGTGAQVFGGTVVDGRSQPLPGVLVTLDVVGLSSTTDAAGSFEIETAPLSGDVTFTFSSAGKSAQATVSGVPGDAVRVTVTFKYDEENESAEPLEVGVEKDDDDDESNSSSSRSSSSRSSSSQSSSAGQSSSDDDDSSSSDSSEDDDSSSSDDDSSSSDDDDDDSSSSSSSSEDDEDGDGDDNGSSSSRSRD